AIQSAGKELDDMILAEFDEEKFAKSLFEQGKAEGIKEGIIKGKAEGKDEGIKEGIIKGKAEGKDEGTEETRIQVVIRMIQNNYSDDSIQSIVPAYSLEEILKLREDLQNHPENYIELLN
ncbi:MAG: hypothetical protein IKD68_14525, partial [Solobacterium sp.]|nr:hypothetical protein [Solobacterium sp.]